VFDAFVSYRHSDAETVRSLVAALERRGLRLWFDESLIPAFGGISDAARQGLAESKAIVVHYSEEYPQSAPCQWELTSAFLAAERLGDPRQRVLVVNPEPGPGHIEPVELRDALYQTVDGSNLQVEMVADAIAHHLAKLDRTLGDGTLSPALWLPSQPSGATRFVGRQREMWRIHSALHANEAELMKPVVGPSVAQVRGLGGLGKSLLAREYALRFAAGYPGGVFWLYAQGDLAAGSSETEREALRLDQIRSFAVYVLGPERALSLVALSPKDVEGVLRNALAGSERCLWVVDDMPSGLSADEVQRWLGPACASTLVTTRSGEYGAFMTEISLGVLQPDEALEMLSARRAPADAEELAAARAVVSELGGHALALDVAGGTLRFQSYSELLEHLRDPTEDELELAAELCEELPTGRERSISATLSHSLDRLDGDGQDLLRLASMMSREPIPRSFLVDIFAHVDGSTSSAARARTFRALDQALSLSLIEPVEGERWQVHPLLARTVGLKGTDTTRQALLRQSAVAVLKDRFAEVKDPATWKSIRELVSHARRFVQEATTIAEVELLGRIARYDYEIGDFKTAKLGSGREITSLTERLGPRHPDTLSAMVRLAGILRQMADLNEAKELCTEVLETTRAVLGPRHVDTLTVMAELGLNLYDLGEVQEARKLQDEVLAGRREVLGPEHRDTLRAMDNLSNTLWAVDVQESRTLQMEALDIFRKVLGPRHPETLRAMTNQAYTLKSLGDPEACGRIEEEVLAIRLVDLGQRHPHTLLVMNNLADTLRILGDLNRARDLAQKTLDLREEVLGPRHPFTITTMDTLACVLRELGELEKARDLGNEALSACREVYGPEHYVTIAMMNNMAETLRAMSDFQGALPLAEEALSACREGDLGLKHPLALTAMSNIAAAHKGLGDLDSAREVGERTLAACRETFGPEHALTVATQADLARTLEALEDRGRT
jgi:tetratricopeptide (TPR) repeat protein